MSGIGTCGERFAQGHRGHRLVAGGGEQTAHLERVRGRAGRPTPGNHRTQQGIGLRGVSQRQANASIANAPLDDVGLGAVGGIEIGKDPGVAAAHGEDA